MNTPIKPVWGDEYATALREFLNSAYGQHVHLVQTENGVALQGAFHDLLVERNITHQISSTSTPQSQGGSMKRCGNFTSWIRLVPDVERLMNNTISTRTKRTPLDLFNEEGTNQTVVDKMTASAAKRYYSKSIQRRTTQGRIQSPPLIKGVSEYPLCHQGCHRQRRVQIVQAAMGHEAGALHRL